MSELYYTPELDDLTIGLQCEVYNISQSQWQKFVFDGSNAAFYETSFLIRDKNIRVAYLTKTDIETEGFKEEQDFTGNKYLRKLVWSARHDRNEPMDIIYNYVSHWMLIQGETTRFSGTINNKSEFRKLLKMLGI